MVRLHSKLSFNIRPGEAVMYLAASCSYLVGLSFGFTIGYSSPAIPDMEKSSLISSQGASAFGALMTVGAVIGCPIAGWSLEKFGRRGSLIVSSIPMIFGWILITMAGPSSTNFLFLGRLLTGMASGISTVAMGVYVAETSTKDYRGMLGSGVQLSITIGILIVYTLGMFFGWRSLALIGCLPPIAAIVLATRVPEAPRWYLLKSRRAEAIRALQELRSTMDVEEELQEIEDGLPMKGDTFSWSDLLKPEAFRPLKVIIMLMVFQQASGINVVMFFTVSIFESAGLKGSSIMATIAIGAVQVVATAGAVYMMDRAGRRILLFLGGTIMAISCFTMALYYHWAAITPIPHLTWMAIGSLMFYIIGFSIGWGPIPMLLMSEVFPVKVRGAASAISCVSNWGVSFLITSQFMSFVNTFGQASGYGFFCIATLLGTFLVYLYVPETKGKSLEEIELYFMGRIIHGV